MAAVIHPIRTWRLKHKQSQEALAAAIGCRRSHLSLVETGVNRPSADLALRIAKETGMALEDVLFKFPEGEMAQ